MILLKKLNRIIYDNIILQLYYTRSLRYPKLIKYDYFRFEKTRKNSKYPSKRPNGWQENLKNTILNLFYVGTCEAVFKLIYCLFCKHLIQISDDKNRIVLLKVSKINKLRVPIINTYYT